MVHNKAPIHVVITLCGNSMVFQSITLIKTALLFTTKRPLRFTVFTEDYNIKPIIREVIINSLMMR